MSLKNRLFKLECHHPKRKPRIIVVANSIEAAAAREQHGPDAMIVVHPVLRNPDDPL